MGHAGPLFLTWAYLQPEDMDEIMAMKSKADKRKRLADFLGIDKEDGLPTEILKDFHWINYDFCISSGFSAEKTAAFVSIMRLVQEESSSRRLGVQEAFDEQFKPWLLKHGVQRPPFSVGVFTFEEITLLTEFAMGTFFRHYKLYTYAYVPHRVLEFQGMPSGCPAPTAPPEAELKDEDVVAPEDQPELAFIFRAQEEARAREMADAMLEELDLESRGPEVKSALEKRIAAMMSRFDEKLRAQDENFDTLMKESTSDDA